MSLNVKIQLAVLCFFLLNTLSYGQNLLGTISNPTANFRQELRFLSTDTVILASIDFDNIDNEPFSRYVYNGNDWVFDTKENIRLNDNASLTDYALSCDGRTLITLSIIDRLSPNSDRVTAQIDVFQKTNADWILIQKIDSLDLRTNGDFLSLRFSISDDGGVLALVEIDGSASGGDDQASIFTIYNLDFVSNNYRSVYADTLVSFRIWDARIDISGNGQTVAIGQKEQARETLSIYDQNTEWEKTESLNINNSSAPNTPSSLPSINYDGNLISFVKNPAPLTNVESYNLVYNRQEQRIDSLPTRGPGIVLDRHKISRQGNRLLSTHGDEGQILQDTVQYYSMMKYENGDWIKEFQIAYDVLPIGYTAGTNLQFDCAGQRFSTSDLDGVIYIYDLDRINSVAEIHHNENLVIYPNPHRHNFYIDGEHIRNQSVRAYDLLGHQVSIQGNHIDGYELVGPSGIYTIRWEDKQNYFTQKIIKL